MKASESFFETAGNASAVISTGGLFQIIFQVFRRYLNGAGIHP